MTVVWRARSTYRESGRVDGGIHVDDFLQQRSYGAERVPQHGRQVLNRLPLATDGTGTKSRHE